jgi:hypothetical protein
LVFGVLVLPGYLLSNGIEHGRGTDASKPDLYVLAKAVFASLIWLFFTYWLGIDDLVRWVDKDTLGDHSVPAALWRGSLLIFAPYLVGRLLGRAVERQTPLLAPVLNMLGIGTSFGTPWDLAWERVGESNSPILVTVTLEDGRKVAGHFGAESRASVSPQSPAIYLEEAYETDKSGNVVVYDRGAHIDGEKISAIAFEEL